MQVRPKPAKLETGHSDHWVAALVAASKASGINILSHWLPGLPLVLLGTNDPCKANPSVNMEVGAPTSKYAPYAGTPSRNCTGRQQRLCRRVTASTPFGHLQPAYFRNYWSASAQVVWNRPGRATVNKNISIAWCLYEAMRDDERNFLRRVDCMSVLQDSWGQ